MYIGTVKEEGGEDRETSKIHCQSFRRGRHLTYPGSQHPDSPMAVNCPHAVLAICFVLIRMVDLETIYKRIPSGWYDDPIDLGHKS